MTFLIFGAGYSGKAFARSLNSPVYGTTRSPAGFAALRAANIMPLQFDGPLLNAPLVSAMQETSHLIISTPPDETGDPVLTAMAGLANQRQAMPGLQWIAYLSTLGVYGDHGGRWIDETTACHPAAPHKARRLAAEQAWQTFAQQAEVPLAILRLGGIYGAGRNALVQLQNATARRIIKPGQVFNRIHVADIAGALGHLAEQKQSGIFNICDNEPAPPQDVISFAAKLMGVAPPAEIAFDKADMSPMAKSFYADNKRASNARLLNSGYHLRYTDYRQGLTDMWQTDQWQCMEEAL